MTEKAASPNLASELFEELCDGPAQEWRRDGARRDTHEAIDLEYPTEEGMNVSLAYALNVAIDSMGITCRREFNKRDRVRVRRAVGETWTDAVVMHCTPTVGGYKIGLKMV